MYGNLLSISLFQVFLIFLILSPYLPPKQFMKIQSQVFCHIMHIEMDLQIIDKLDFS